MAKKSKADPCMINVADQLTPIITFLLGMQLVHRAPINNNLALESFLHTAVHDLQRAQDYLREAAHDET